MDAILRAWSCYMCTIYYCMYRMDAFRVRVAWQSPCTRYVCTTTCTVYTVIMFRLPRLERAEIWFAWPCISCPHNFFFSFASLRTHTHTSTHAHTHTLKCVYVNITQERNPIPITAHFSPPSDDLCFIFIYFLHGTQRMECCRHTTWSRDQPSPFVPSHN